MLVGKTNGRIGSRVSGAVEGGQCVSRRRGCQGPWTDGAQVRWNSGAQSQYLTLGTCECLAMARNGIGTTCPTLLSCLLYDEMVRGWVRAGNSG